MRRDGFFPPASWFIDCLKGKSGPFRFPRSFAGAEMGPGEEKPAGHTLVWPRVLTKHGHISARQNRVCPCPSMLVFPIATVNMKNGELYKFIIFNKSRFAKWFQEYSR